MEPEPVKGHLQEKREASVDGAPSNNELVSSWLSSSGPPLDPDTGKEGHVSSSSIEHPFDRNLSFGPELESSPDATNEAPRSRASGAPLKLKIQTQNSSPMKSPPMQVMEEPPGYDPDRIPAEVFSIKSTNPADWSATSNESLFSIQMGNNSFSRDYAILFGKSGEFGRLDDWNHSPSSPFWMSGELPRLDEWDNAQANPQPTLDQTKPNDLISMPNKVPPTVEAPPGEVSRVESSNDRKSPKVTPEASMANDAKEKPLTNQSGVNSPEAAAKIPDVKNATPAETTNPTPTSPLTFPSPPRCSDESGNSGSSFAFPVLVNDSGKAGVSLKAVPEKSPEPQMQSESESESKSKSQSQEPEPEPEPEPKPEPESQQKINEEPPKPPNTRRFPFLSCFPQCC